MHDCEIVHIDKHDGDLTWNFSYGYWIGETNSQNIHKKTLGTDSDAVIVLSDAHCEKIVLNDVDIFTWEEFCLKINTGEWIFEIVTETYENNKCTYYGWIHFEKEPYDLRCDLYFTFKNIVYNWNDICNDRPWS